jgi:type VI secretion system protein ImpF
MATVALKNRMSPPLMFAFRFAHRERDAKRDEDLRDESGERILAPRRSAVQLAVTEKMLRDEVRSDLEQLMNTTALGASVDLSSVPEVRKSILNYGFPDMVRRTLDEAEVAATAKEIETALALYEPRLIKNTIKVQRDETADSAALQLRFIVQADLACNPVQVPVEFVADVESTSGKIAINRL